MKREVLLRHLRRCGCVVRREGKEHSLWENPQTGHAEAVPGISQSRIFWLRGFAESFRLKIHPVS
jgi:hypothetical protein